jgi:Flp pilus assembly protein TadD
MRQRKNQPDIRPIVVCVCGFLVAIVFAAFGRALRYGFVEYDDPDYVYQNVRIIGGLSLDSISWALSHVHAQNWHPLTTISHMLDCQIYGLQPWGHHLTNLLLHAAAAVLLFFALLRLTSTPDARPSASNIWPCAFVAALFAVHPLRVESVAWISERKDVLSGVFFMLTLLAYARYARSARFFIGRYLTVLVLFVLGLMCKPTLVTLPFVLLLLDYWPLGRWQPSSTDHRSRAGGQKSAPRSQFAAVPRLIIEKLPLFALSAASCLATMIAQKQVLELSLQMNFIERANNAVISYVAYLGEMIWPAHLSVSHVYAEGYRNLPEAVASLILLLVISALCFFGRKKYPFLLTGWLWYIGMLVPMIGLVQVSSQARADRYTYLSQIGLYIMLTWGALTVFCKWRWPRSAVVAPALVVIIALGLCSYGQTACWQDSEALWRHALDHSPSDYIAHESLGFTLLQKGELNEAKAEYEKAIQLKPNYARAQNNLGNALMQSGQVDEAATHYQMALELTPNDPQVNNNVGTTLLRQGRVDEAIAQYRKAVATGPAFAELHYNLGSALIVRENWNEAIDQFETALRIDANYPEAHNKLGIALGATGRTTEAIEQFREALRLHHLYPQAHFNLGCALVYLGQRQEGIAHLTEAVRLKPDYHAAKEKLRELGEPPP